MDKREKELAVCQMITISAVLSGGGMDVNTALQQLGLDNDECMELAKNEGLDWIAERIKLLK